MPSEPAKFVLFSGLHLLILFLTIALPVAMARCVRKETRPRLARGFSVGLVAVLVLDYVFVVVWAFHVGKITRWADALPLQLCDWAAIACILALLWRHQQPYENAYFWGLSGTFQALLTPDVPAPFPSPLFIGFFLSHSAIVVAILYMTWGLGFRPRRGAILRAWAWSQVYLVCAGTVNWLTGTNFGYLARKPPHASLLDFFGPWPWYLLVLEVVALMFYAFFYAPIWVANRRREANAARIPPEAGT